MSDIWELIFMPGFYIGFGRCLILPIPLYSPSFNLHRHILIPEEKCLYPININ